jgi:hypothetical protein
MTMIDGSLTRIRLLDLRALDARVLQRLLPNDSYEIEKDKLPPLHQGSLEVVTTIVAVASLPVIQALAAWLLKRRDRQTVRLSVEKITPDHASERFSLEITLSASEAPQLDVIRQITEGLKLDRSLIDKAVTGGHDTSDSS